MASTETQSEVMDQREKQNIDNKETWKEKNGYYTNGKTRVKVVAMAHWKLMSENYLGKLKSQEWIVKERGQTMKYSFDIFALLRL